MVSQLQFKESLIELCPHEYERGSTHHMGNSAAVYCLKPFFPQENDAIFSGIHWIFIPALFNDGELIFLACPIHTLRERDLFVVLEHVRIVAVA
jgi:hypothetical protein